METADVIAVVAATVVAMLVGACLVLVVTLTRALRSLREAVDELREETIALLDDAAAAVHAAAVEVERVDRLVTSAERLSGAVDAASGLAYRTLASPVVKAMAFGTGVSRAAQRLRRGEPAPAPRRRRLVARRGARREAS